MIFLPDPFVCSVGEFRCKILRSAGVSSVFSHQVSRVGWSIVTRINGYYGFRSVLTRRSK